jgi:phosphoenolpyruvate-protein kinase (PTS system EI component)
MDDQALERARKRVAEARETRFETTRMEAALVRARAQIDALTAAADELQSQLPEQVGLAVEEGLRRQVVPVARTLAEIKGLVNQANRRLERVEQEVLAERAARIDDLSVLVDLVASGWRGVDERLRRIEQHGAEAETGGVVPLPPGARPAEATTHSAYAQAG